MYKSPSRLFQRLRRQLHTGGRWHTTIQVLFETELANILRMIEVRMMIEVRRMIKVGRMIIHGLD